MGYEIHAQCSLKISTPGSVITLKATIALIGDRLPNLPYIARRVFNTHTCSLYMDNRKNTKEESKKSSVEMLEEDMLINGAQSINMKTKVTYNIFQIKRPT